MILMRDEGNRKRSRTDLFIIAGFALIAAVAFLPGAVAGVDCSAPGMAPIVDFTYTVSPSDTTPLMVNFVSTSKPGKIMGSGLDPIESYFWRFGDGTNSSAKNPSHAYATSTSDLSNHVTPYEVTLTVTSECRKFNTTTKNIQVYCTCAVANYNIVTPAGGGPYTAPATLVIRDTSTHAPAAVTKYSYTLYRVSTVMEGSRGYSTDKNPTVFIPDSNRYYLTQEVRKACSYACPNDRKTIYFNVTDPVTLQTTTPTTAVTTTTTTAITTTVPITFTSATQAVAAMTTATATTAAASSTTVPVQPPTLATSGTGTLSVATNPSGAQVFVDDVLRGLSPAVIPEMPAGSHTLRLEKSGYRNMTVPVSIGDGRTTEYSTALEAESGGMGILPIIAVILVIAAGAGAAYWYLKKKSPGTGEQK